MATKTYAQREAEILADPERRERITRDTALLLAGNQLARLREAAGLTQTDVARKLHITQSRVSKLESADDLNVSTLVRYVGALGGEFTANVKIGKETIPFIGKTPESRSSKRTGASA